MILSCQNIAKSFSDHQILSHVSFHIEDNEKAAIVGINGAGKTTLLRIIIGEMQADEGLVTLSRNKTMGYLAQNGAVDTSNTIYGELLSVKQELVNLEQRMRDCEEAMKQAAGGKLEALMKQYASLTHAFETGDGYVYKSELVGVLKGLGFGEEDFGKSVSTLSGGQKTRVALGKLLLQKPDLIILDEPTNHLDMNSITWLEAYLSNYRGAVLIVSHDRFFLDRIAAKIIELDQAKATVFSGNYSDYAVKKEALRAAAWSAYLNQQREIRRQEEVIEKLKSFNREKSIKRAESREKMLDKIEVLEKPAQARADMKLKLTPYIQSGNDVLTVENLSKSFGEQRLFAQACFEIKRGEHVAVIGDNGTGKTTLLKILNGLTPPDSGTFRLGANVEIGYYDQEHHVLHSEKTLFEEISDDYPYLTNTEIRSTLAAFLFTGDDVFKRICDLSGGERGRVSLAKLMLGSANFLILDEPTNHLDILSKEILEDALNGYEGTVLYVSHDRYFINKTASRILDLAGGQFVNYIGSYDYYLEKHDAVMAAASAPRADGAQMGNAPKGSSGNSATGSPGNSAKNSSGNSATGSQGHSAKVSSGNSAISSSGHSAKASFGNSAEASMNSSISGAAPENNVSNAKQDWKAQKEEQAKLRKKENDLKKCEEKIARAEARAKEIDEEMCDPAIGTQAARLQELAREREALDTELGTLYGQWEELAE